MGTVRRLQISPFWLLCLLFIAGFAFRFLWMKVPHTPQWHYWLHTAPHNNSSPASLEKEPQTPNTTQGTGSSYPTAVEQELQTLMKVIEWPAPPGPTEYNFSTSPLTTEFQLLFPRGAYYVGEYLEVFITARDHGGRPKAYGGDYFQAKLHSPTLKAGVTGSVTDHRNGTYTASFLLLWPGQVEISIRLVHSSEAIAVLKDKRETRPDKVYFNGYFHGTGEVVECNLNPPARNVCEYHDAYTGESWFCIHPKQVPCSAYKGTATGGSREIHTPEEARLLDKSVKEKLISSKVKPFVVLSPAISVDSRANCSSGLPNPEPSGFYYQDIWYSRVCKNRAFPHPDNVTKCLTGKIMYMFGDSTTKQWFEFLLRFVPSLQRQDLHAQFPAPQLAVDMSNKFAIQWQMHEKPLLILYGDRQEVHYVATELERIGSNKEGLLVVINCMAHFVTFPVKVYVRRLQGIRDSVVRLMKRNPLAKVFIKSANTGYVYTHSSDWLSLQLDLVMRAMFSGLPVTILDTWQMTSCHYLPRDIHPGPVIVKNEVDLLLSFICPT
uniref:Neurexophilin and PC-esterase domain family member 3 like gene 2 n=1 Tax=Xenopus tropicalis TaxID=8364 RepID=A0A803K0Q6_XENTR